MGGLTFRGIPKAARQIEALAAQVQDQVPGAVRAELEIESTESQRRTPVLTGALRASHTVAVAGRGQETVGTISVGGPSAPYAVFVHENLEAFHPVGQAKFLESTLVESAPHLAGRIAARLRLTVR